MSLVQSTLSLIILVSSLWLTACASSGPNANLNEMATLEALEARMEALEAKTNRALKQSAAAKIDASTALLIAQQAGEKEE